VRHRQVALGVEDEVGAKLPEIRLLGEPWASADRRHEVVPEIGVAEGAERAAAADPKSPVADPGRVGEPEVRVCQRPREAFHVLGSGKRDDGDLTPGCLNLVRVSTKLRQVVLAEEAAEMAKKDQDGWRPEQLPGGEALSGHVAQFEVELDSRHRVQG